MVNVSHYRDKGPNLKAAVMMTPAHVQISGWYLASGSYRELLRDVYVPPHPVAEVMLK